MCKANVAYMCKANVAYLCKANVAYMCMQTAKQQAIAVQSGSRFETAVHACWQSGVR